MSAGNILWVPYLPLSSFVLPYYIFRWSELTRKIDLVVEIQELSEQGEYSPVEVQPKPDVLTGGVYQLRQGQQRRIQVSVRPVQHSGTLPIICETVCNIALGSVCIRSVQKKIGL